MFSTGMPSTRDCDSGCLDSKGRFDHQTHACEGHANELCATFRLPQFGSYLVPRRRVASELQGYDLQCDNRER